VTAPSPAFRRLALATCVATFALIVLGGMVRVTDSGLGCGPAGSGFHGWPLCEGSVIPGVSLHSVVEYSHRAAASLVAVLILSLAFLAWRRHRDNRALVWTAGGAGALVLAQGLLGAVVVEKNLKEVLVASHLGLAMLLLGLTLYVWRASRPGVAGTAPADGGPGLRLLAVAAGGTVLATIVAGGYMAGTQHYGRADYQLGDGAHHACGKEFPTCNGEFMPFGQSRLVDIHLAHRALMYLAALLIVALAATALRRRPSAGIARSAWLALGLLLAQVLLGALNVWLDEYEALIVAHLAVGSLLWAAVVGLGLQLYRVPAAAGAAETRAATATEAVTA
jgi:heme A synthase